MNKKYSAIAGLVAGGVAAGLVGFAPVASAAPSPTPVAYYKNCQAARDAGVAPIYRGQDGYRSALDRDGDGVACETGSAPKPAPQAQPAPQPQPAPQAQPKPQAKPQPKPKKKAPKSKPNRGGWGSVEFFS